MTEHLDECRRLLPDAVRVDATGSRVICPAAILTPENDHDVLALVPSLKAAADALVAKDFKPAASMSEDGNGVIIAPEQKFASLKRGTLNIIAIEDEKFYDAFTLATRVAAKLGLNTRNDRVTLFQALLYGNG